MPLLQARDIHKRFGGVTALDGASLELRAGEVHVLIGANGCGKSTLCKIIAGALDADAGELTLDGQPIRFRTPQQAGAAGIAVFYQELSLVPQLGVAENLFLGHEPRGCFGRIDRRRLAANAESALTRFRAVLRPDFGVHQRVADLEPDERQIVEILKVLVRRPRLIIFDEATAALDRRQVDAFFGLIRELKSQGNTIVFISHRMDEIMAIGDRVTVMRNGRTVATLDVAHTDRDQLVRLMVGETLAGIERTAHQREREPLMTVTGLRGERLDSVSFQLHRGEILGLGGLQGQGQSALLRTLFGAWPRRAGRILLAGRELRLRRPAEAMAHGFGFISGDRGRDGVFAIRPIFENLISAMVGRERLRVFSRDRLTARVAPFMQRLATRFAGYDAPVAELSGGNQQKIVVARWLAAGPHVWLLDDPTKGIDLQSKRDLYLLMQERVMAGDAVILYSTEDEELLANADRILVFNSGRVVRELQGADLNAYALYRAAYGEAA